MTSYEERLPLIDKAIDYYKGKLPREANPDATLIISAFGSYYFISEEYFNTCGIESEFVCYEEEFEQRVKEREEMSELKLGNFYSLNELSKIDGAFDKGNFYLYVGESDGVYLSGKVYPTNGRGIVDEYDEGNHTSFCNLGGVTPDFQLVALLNSQLEDVNKNDWYEKGELPPANIECEVKIEGQWLPTVVIGHYANEAVVVDPCVTVQRFFCTTVNNLRPLQSETDKLVDEALETLKSNYATHLSFSDLDLKMCAEVMIEAGYRKVKLMSRDEVISKIFGLTDNIGMADAATLYDAGCRFIDKGE